MYISDVTIGAPSGHTNGYLGGAQRTVSDHPFVKGYFYVFFGFPAKLFDNSSGISADSARKFLLTSAEAFTPPSDRQINTGDIQGMGGIAASFITGQTISRDFSIQYKDYWGSPIFRVHKVWTNYINPYLGASSVATRFAPQEYKGVCMIIQTKPIARKVGENTDTDWTADDIIKVNLFDGVQCLTDFNSVYDSNIADNSFVKPVAQYKFDGYHMDETNADVLNKAVDILNNSNLFTDTQALYRALSTGTVGSNSIANTSEVSG